MTAEGARFFSRANLEFQRLTRDAIEGILEACFGDYHLTAMRNNRSYRRFYARIRCATDTRAIGELMKQAYGARRDGNLSVKHFIALNTAADNQRERLLSAPLSVAAYRLIEGIVTASEKKLEYMGWAMYSGNDQSHPVHRLNSQERKRVWEVWNGCKELLPLSQLKHIQLSAKLCATWGRALPVACFILQAVAIDLFEPPRLRQTIAIILNRRSATTRKPSKEHGKPVAEYFAGQLLDIYRIELALCDDKHSSVTRLPGMDRKALDRRLAQAHRIIDGPGAVSKAPGPSIQG